MSLLIVPALMVAILTAILVLAVQREDKASILLSGLGIPTILIYQLGHTQQLGFHNLPANYPAAEISGFIGGLCSWAIIWFVLHFRILFGKSLEQRFARGVTRQFLDAVHIRIANELGRPTNDVGEARHFTESFELELTAHQHAHGMDVVVGSHGWTEHGPATEWQDVVARAVHRLRKQ